MDPTLLRYALATKEQKKFGSCWLESLAGFKLCSRNNMQQGVSFSFLIMSNKSKSKPSSDVLLKEILLHCFVEP